MTSYGVMHIDLGPTFRGGQRQVYNLVRYMKENDIETGCVVASGSTLETRLTDLGVTTYPIRYSGFDIVTECVRLRRICGEMGYSIVHAHDSHSHNLALAMKFVNPALRIVVSRRVLSGMSKTLMSRWKYRSQQTDLFIAVSSAVADELIEWGVPEGRVAHVPSCVDRMYFNRTTTDDFRREHSIPEKRFYIGTACALDQNKDVATLINAVGKLSYTRDDCLLLVAGDGDGREELERLARFIEIEDRVRFLGQVSQMPQFYSLLDVYVLSSRTEGLGTSLLEAGACGCVPVSSDCGGPSDFIDDGRNGFLFPAEDDETLSLILDRVLGDDTLRKNTAKSFLEKIDEYDMERVCQRIIGHYNRLALLTG